MRIISMCFVIAMFLSSCTMAPRVANQPYSSQEKLVSVTQWESLAKQVVDLQIIPSIPTEQKTKFVYIENEDTTEFAKAFHAYLITELVKKGLQPSQYPDNALIFKWGAQLVWNNKVASSPGIIIGAIESIGSVIGGSALFYPPDTIEVIITTQVNKGPTILSRMSNNYYMDDSSKWNFFIPNPPKQKPEIEIAQHPNIDYSHYIFFEPKKAVVIRHNNSTIYEKPGYSDVVGTASVGSVMTAVGEKKNWYLVELDLNKSGWIEKRFVDRQ